MIGNLCLPLLICTIINKNPINENITSNIQFSQQSLSDISGNSQFSFNKCNTTINHNRLVSLLSNSLSVGNMLLNSSNRIKNIKDKLHDLHKDAYKDKSS